MLKLQKEKIDITSKHCNFNSTAHAHKNIRLYRISCLALSRTE